jgi:predicted RNA-binding Zn-ribbon protein involved in translation (DUF1610 family)
MKIQIENSKGLGITATGLSDYLSRNEMTNITGAMFDVIAMVNSYENAECKKTATPEQIESIKEEMSKAALQAVPIKETREDRMIIRPRIPNNVVDINELTIEKAVTENALVRCPNCGQAHCLAVPSGNHIYLMRRDFKDNEFGIIAEFDSLNSEDFVNVCCKPETDRNAYYQDLQQMSFMYNTDFAVNNDTELFCPVCCKSHAFSSWKDAFENPLAYFETEALCDACGGEKLEKLIKKRKIYQCDKCGLQSDFKERGE